MLFLLNETATLYRRIGQRDGKPAYSDTGTDFPCRTQPIDSVRAGARGYSGDADTRVFALPDLDCAPGDRIVTADGARIVTEVNRRRAFSAVHHLEILGKRGG